MGLDKGKHEIMAEMPYPLGYVEKIFDKTLEKYEKKLGGFDTSRFFDPKTEEIGKRVSQILSERSVIPINKGADYENSGFLTYYRSIPQQDVNRYGRYSAEIFKTFRPYRRNSTIEHIGIKHKDSDLEMVITFAGRSEVISCAPYMMGYISERPYSKARKKLTNQDKLRVKTRKFFVDAFNNYYKTNLDYRDFSKEFVMDSFWVLKKEKLDGLADILINHASPLLNDLIDAKEKLPADPKKMFRTEAFIEMIVDYVENRF